MYNIHLHVVLMCMCIHMYMYSVQCINSHPGGEEDGRRNFQIIPSVYHNNVRRVCRKYDIRTVFTTITTLQQQLTRDKDTNLDLRKVWVVYRTSSGCGLAYISET